MPEKTVCPDCNGKKDCRARRCRKCNNKLNPPRLNTGVDFRIGGTGYVMVMRDRKECYFHRVVMEEFLGRSLKKGEVVHHCDGDRTNNSIENLELMRNSEHHRKHFTSAIAKKASVLGHKARWGYVSDIRI